MNLIINAQMHAQGGRIVIETRDAELHEDQAISRWLVALVMLSVSDTGTVDGPTMARIFDPFFTTKGAGRELAWDSPWCTNRKQSNGYIWVTSEPGKCDL
jgi:signal transduction histidine kinase